jgi:hypothetical protein
MKLVVRKFLVFSLFPLLLGVSGCASQSTKTAVNLDPSKPDYSSDRCSTLMAEAKSQDEIKLSRTIASPVVIMLSGGVLALPVLAVNAGFDAFDHMTASDMAIACGGEGKSLREISKDVVKGVGFGIAVGGVTPGAQSR